MSWIDRALGAVAPRVALKRLTARQALDAAQRAYAGAALGRHTEGWRAPNSSADAEIAAAGSRLRDRHRDLVRNNPHAAKAISSWVSSIVGDGIMPRSSDRKVMAAFEAWVNECDADGQLDFYGLQTLACREMVEAGEVLLRRRRRRQDDGLAAPLQVQLIEADLLDSSRVGDRTIQGIEFDALGRRRSYWLFAEHPGNSSVVFRGRTESKPVDAADIAHVYEKQRTQVRGVPWGAPVLRALRDLDDYEFAEIVRKKIEACYVGAVIGHEEAEQGIAPSVVDGNNNRIEKFEPGLIAYVRGGKEITFNAPHVVAGYADYKKAALKTIAAGYRLPYELLSGDLSEVNFSSMRGGLIEFRRLVRAIQWQVFIPMCLQPLWDWFTEAAYLAGRISDPVVPVEWSPPKFEWVDPTKDVLAELLAIRAGIRTWPEVVAQNGRNPDDVLSEIADWNGRLDEKGIVLDSDPRRVAKSGASQSEQQPAALGSDRKWIADLASGPLNGHLFNKDEV